MKLEYQLMRDMLERANQYLDIPNPECHKTGAMLRQAATVMMHWDLKIVKLEMALKRILDYDVSQNGPAQNRMDAVRKMAREALE